MPAGFSLKVAYDVLPKDLIRELALAALERGQDRAQVISDIVDIVDAEIDWAKVFPKAPGIVTDAVEKYDAPVIKALVGFIVHAVEVSRVKKGK